jgi:hypothetical protein
LFVNVAQADRANVATRAPIIEEREKKRGRVESTTKP